MHRSMRILVLLLAVALVGAACGGDDGGDGGTTATETNGTETGGDGGAATTSVEMQDFAFEPSEISVASGDEVQLENVGEAPHTFTLTDGDVDVEVAPGESASATIDAEPGEYDLICRFHPQMTGTVTVS